jgi:nitric oxide reductase activation protein
MRITKSLEAFTAGMQGMASTVGDKDLRIIFEGTNAMTDGSMITVPDVSILDRDNATPEEMLEAASHLVSIRGYVYHEVAHVLHSDFEAFKRIKARPRFAQLVNLLEDVRIERKIGSRYPGMKYALDHLNAWLETKCATAEQIAKSEIHEQVLAAFWTMIFGFEKHPSFAAFPPAVQALALAARGVSDKALAEATTSAVMTAAIPVWDALGLVEKTEEEQQQPGEPGEPRCLIPDARQALQALMREEQKETAAEADVDSPAAENPGQHVRRGRDQARTYRVYTTRHDKYETVKAAKPADLTRLRTQVSASFGVVQRALTTALQFEVEKRNIYAQESGVLDANSLHRLAMASTSTHPGVQQQGRQVFSQRQRRITLDAACGILIDVSGSMSGRIELAKQALCLLADVLHHLRIPFVVDAHTTGDDHSYEPAKPIPDIYTRLTGSVLAQNVKEFGEAWPAAAHRLPNLKAMNANYDAEAVERSARKLLTRKEARKVLFVLSDGSPSCSYQESTVDFESHLKHVVRRYTQAGVQIVGIGIDTKSVQAYYPTNVVVDSLTSLPAALSQQLIKAMTLGGRK